LTELANILQDNVDISTLEVWIGNMEEFEVIWEFKIVDLSQKRKHNSDDKKDEFSSNKLTVKTRKSLESVQI
jgi:hypothetical protein